MQPPEQRILLTGATGLLGSYIARLLVRQPGWTVTACKRATSSLSLLGDAKDAIEWHTGDLLDHGFQDELFADSYTAVVHAAGLVSYATGMRDQLRHTNTQLTSDLVNLSLQHGINHFLHISSIAAISPLDPHAPLREDLRTFHKTAHTTRYAKSKFAAELQVWRASEEGLPVTILNPAVVLGAGFWDRSSSRLFRWVARGQRYYPPGTTVFVDARDVAAFVVHCLRENITGERFVLSAEARSYGDFFAEVAGALDVAPPVKQVQAWQAELAWRGAMIGGKLRGTPPLLTRESARRSLVTTTADNRRSLAAGAHYRPLSQTIQDTAACYLKTAERGYGILPLP